MTGPNLYGYFDNKQAILAAVIERGVQGHWIDLTDVLRSNHSPDLALDAVVRAYVKRSRGWVGLSHAVKDDAKLLASYRDSEREYVTEWAHLLCAARPGLAEGEARARVVIALSMVDTLMRTKSLATPSGFLENTTRMALAVLHS